ncbi:hypothetical protein BC828DRAFT_386977 [Blastocladiella britannica]|nr:hypothetical protein BC828DRAFT_386977 [Blastocladiella britannica]
MLLEPDLASTVVSVLHHACCLKLKDRCLLCCVQVRLIQQLAATAAGAKRYDTLVALFDGGLVGFLSCSITNLKLVKQTDSDTIVPLIRTILAYIQSDVCSHPSCGARAKVGTWCSEVQDLAALHKAIRTGCMALQETKMLAADVEAHANLLYGELNSDEEEEERGSTGSWYEDRKGNEYWCEYEEEDSEDYSDYY